CAGPDAAFGNRFGLGVAQVAALGDACLEAGIGAVERRLELLVALRREILDRSEQRGVVRGLHRVGAGADLVEQAADQDLAGDAADRAGEGGRLGDDLVGVGGDVIAALAGDAAHADDYLLAGRARRFDRVPLTPRPPPS